MQHHRVIGSFYDSLNSSRHALIEFRIAWTFKFFVIYRIKLIMDVSPLIPINCQRAPIPYSCHYACPTILIIRAGILKFFPITHLELSCLQWLFFISPSNWEFCIKINVVKVLIFIISLSLHSLTYSLIII